MSPARESLESTHEVPTGQEAEGPASLQSQLLARSCPKAMSALRTGQRLRRSQRQGPWHQRGDPRRGYQKVARRAIIVVQTRSPKTPQVRNRPPGIRGPAPRLCASCAGASRAVRRCRHARRTELPIEHVTCNVARPLSCKHRTRPVGTGPAKNNLEAFLAKRPEIISKHRSCFL